MKKGWGQATGWGECFVPSSDLTVDFVTETPAEMTYNAFSGTLNPTHFTSPAHKMPMSNIPKSAALHVNVKYSYINTESIECE